MYIYIYCNIVFLLGKRDCLGKTLAINQTYLFFSGMLQNFRFRSIEENLGNIDIEPIVGFTMMAPPFKLIVTER